MMKPGAPDSSKPIIPRSVKPRTVGHTHRPIIVMDLRPDPTGHETRRGENELSVLFERTGELTRFWPGAFRLLTEPSSIIVCLDAARLTAALGEIFGDEERWQYRVTPIKRQIMRSNGEMSPWRVAETCVSFFGFQRANGHGVNLYHYPLDPNLFLRGPVAGLVDLHDVEPAKRLTNLLQWGQDVRTWCAHQDLKVTPTAGGLAGQLLKDSRWFPRDRRKVPGATNARVRPQLPGNFYRLYCDPSDEQYTALYLDMKSSHHTIASTLTFPHPDHLTARGFFDVTDEPGATVADGRPWLRAGTKAFEKVTQKGHGLVYGRLEVPAFHGDGHFPPPYMERPGERMVWAYTNELPLIRELGGRWQYLTAAWVSFQSDPGLNQYARYAITELQKATEERKRWLKPTLLSTYGVLASQERHMEVGFRVAKGGEFRQYPAGSSMLPARARVASRASESSVTNVMYRGMIEAEQRVRAIGLARYVHQHGHRVLAIYADSIFVEGDRVPLLPAGWKVDGVLDGLVFSSATHFTSRQISKLPGIRRDATARVQILADARGHR